MYNYEIYKFMITLKLVFYLFILLLSLVIFIPIIFSLFFLKLFNFNIQLDGIYIFSNHNKCLIYIFKFYILINNQLKNNICINYI